MRPLDVLNMPTPARLSVLYGVFPVALGVQGRAPLYSGTPRGKSCCTSARGSRRVPMSVTLAILRRGAACEVLCDVKEDVRGRNVMGTGLDFPNWEREILNQASLLQPVMSLLKQFRSTGLSLEAVARS